MATSRFEALDHQIWRIDTDYVAPGVAACYLVQGGDQFALIETGSGVSVQPILAALDELGVAREQVRLLIPTHVHLDHAGGLGGLVAALPNAQAYVHPRGRRHMVDPSKLLAGAMAVYGADSFRRMNGEIFPVPEQRCHEAADGTLLQLGDRQLEIRDAPGHARHHLVVWDERSRGFFTGDVFGLCYPQLNIQDAPFMVPTTTPVQFDPQAWNSTLAMMDSYQPQSMYLTHYGQVGDVGRLSSQLAQRVAEHAETARTAAGQGEDALARQLGDQLFQHYLHEGGELQRQQFDQVLGMDLKLNAQGLIHWASAGMP